MLLWRSELAEKTMTKLELAQRQLETAIGLFVSRRDRISAITLAGAADGILHGLVLKAGKQPFADYAMGVTEALSGTTPAKAKFAKHINDTLRRCCMIQLRREWGRFSNFSFRTPQRRIAAYPARPSG